MSTASRLFLVAGLAAGLTAPGRAQILYDNGPLITTPTGACIPAGSTSSEVQAGNTVIGFGDSAAAGERLADEFTVTDPTGWNLTGLDFYAYQTNSSATVSPITQVTVQIWNGRPGDIGSMVIAGDTTTNRLISSTFSGTYRHPNSVCGTTRPLFRNSVALPFTLPPGTYWVDWQVGGDLLLAGPFVPATTYTGFRGPQPPHAAGNARKFNGAAWIDATDPNTGGVPQDLPFTVKGTIVGSVTGACCLTDGTCVLANTAGCSSQGGVYQGDGSTCPGVVCPQPGACCMPDFTCRILTSAQCNASAGVYRGDGVACAAANCPGPPTGACCRLDGTCALLTGAACSSEGGIYRGDNTSCGATPCPATYLQTGLSVAIPDGGATNGTAGASATVTINVPDIGTITDIDANFAITHTWQGDLSVKLQGPLGQIVELVGRPGVVPPKYTPGTTSTYGFANHNYGSATLPFIADDEAAGVYDNAAGFPGPPAGAAAPTDNAGGRWKPTQPLSVFDGTRAQGAWTLTVNDYAASDTGTITRFGLQITATFSCYANCDGSTDQPFLNVNDYVCFQTRFAAGDTNANCDGSTAAPVLNVNDFVCFQTRFAAGCSAP